MRRIDALITQARTNTDNLQYSATAGIQQSELVQSANDAQDKLQSMVLSQHPTGAFETEQIVTCIAGQSDYAIPFDCYLGSRLVDIFYSPTGNDIDYYPLAKRLDRERAYGIKATPQIYIVKGSKVSLIPTPQTGGLIRFTYQKTLPRLDLRRGQVSAVTLSATGITSLTLSTGTSLDAAALLLDNYMTVVDKFGAQHMRKIPFSAVDVNTGIVTVDAGFAFQTGETILVGDYVLSGANATTHAQLPDNCERYLIKYMERNLKGRDSSSDVGVSDAELQSMLSDIVGAFAEPDADVQYVPIIDNTFNDVECY